jgi:uncharacterized membrane protein YsdA (DUF1294 family)
MNDNWILIYFGIVNLISAITFIVDKKLAQIKKSRIPEAVLHFLEALGGVFSIFILMYIIQHKSRKSKYFFSKLVYFGMVVSHLFINEFYSMDIFYKESPLTD